MKNKKGFTLIELLAVIIILGILMIIAIPSVTKYINDSRKEAYIKTAKQVVSGARNLVNEGKLEMFDTTATYYIPNSCIKSENGIAKSPYGEFVKAYVGVIYNGNGYNYYWISVDDTGQGIKNTIESDELNVDDIESDIKESEVDLSIVGNTNIILQLDESDCSSFREYIPGPDPIDTIYNQLKSIYEDNGVVSLYTRAHQDTLNNTGTSDIYHYNGNSRVDNSNNLIFANYCWKIIRTTVTGGIRILYNGFAENDKCLDDRPTNVGYNEYAYVRLRDAEYYYADDYTYDNETKTFTLTGNVIKSAWSSTNSNLISKYVCKTETTTCQTLYYVDSVYTKNTNYYDVYAVNLKGNSNYSQFGTLQYNYVRDDERYVGYMYGDNDDLRNHIIENKYDSTVKKYVDIWYEKYLKKYSNYFEDTIFCNDRRTAGTVNEHNIYFVNAYIPQYNNSSHFTIDCKDEDDMFTTTNPKAKLKYPVALPSTQDIGLLGSDSARKSGGDYWTMSPDHYYSNNDTYYDGAYVEYVGSNGRVEPSAVDKKKITTKNGVRPLVSLKPNTKFYKGTGTKDDPYMVFSP